MTDNNTSLKRKFNVKGSGWKYSAGLRYVLYVLLVVLFYVFLSDKMVPKTYDIELGAVSHKNIVAPRQIENAKETEKAIEAAVQKVQPVYTIVPLHNDQLVDKIYNKLDQLNADKDVSTSDKVDIYRRVFPDLYNQFIVQAQQQNASNGQYNDKLLKEAVNSVNDQIYLLPEEIYFKLPKLKSEDLAAMRPVTLEIVRKLMDNQIVDAMTTRAQVAEMVISSPLTKNTVRSIVQEIAKYAITPNKFYDQEATEQAKAEARESTKPVYIEKSDVVVKKGEVITQELYDRLNDLGLLKDKVNYWPQFGLTLLCLMFVGVLYMFIRQNEISSRYNNSQLLMLGLILLLTVLMMRIVSMGQEIYPYIGYIAPVSMGAMLITILLDAPLAIIASIVFSVLASIFFNMEHSQLFDFRYGFIAAVSCFTSVFAIHRASQRSTILKAGALVSLLSSVAIFAMFLLEKQAVMDKELLLSLSFAIGGGLLTAILVVGLMPFFEVTFGILSALKLVELSNPNHPLLRKLLSETPGTYHHSIMVGNLSETAAEAIGANGLLCRVGSFYHDIGKTKRPGYFIENQQNGENPHDLIEPQLSKSIIVAHASDGVEMLKEYKIPKPIRDIAEQHHGTTLLKYFYHKAMKQAEERGEDLSLIDENEYRYPGPKAQSKEAAVVGIADCVEAAVRSLRKPTVEQIDSMVQKIIKSRLDDQQFNDCDLTLKELDIVAKTLREAVLGIFHSRIEYPEDMPKSSQKGDRAG